MRKDYEAWLEKGSYALGGAILGAALMYFFKARHDENHHADMMEELHNNFDSARRSFDATMNDFKERSFTIYPKNRTQSRTGFTNDQLVIVDPLEASRNATFISDTDDYRDYGLDNTTPEIEVVVTSDTDATALANDEIMGESLDNNDEFAGQTAVRDFGLADEANDRA